jgi:hypothetical protein
MQGIFTFFVTLFAMNSLSDYLLAEGGLCIHFKAAILKNCEANCDEVMLIL